MFNPTPIVALGGGVAGGMFAARDVSSEDTFGDKAAQVGAGSALGAMFGIGAYKAGKFAINSGVGHHYAAVGASGANSYYNGLARDIKRATVEARRIGSAKAGMRFVGRRPMTMASIGAGLGAMVGERYDKPGTGMAVGAGLGAAVSVAAKFGGSRMPFKGSLAAVGVVAGVFAGARALQPEEFESEAEASPEITGYSYAAKGTVAARMNLLGATGDLALGLHNQRHG